MMADNSTALLHVGSQHGRPHRVRRHDDGSPGDETRRWRRVRRVVAGFCVVSLIAAIAGFPIYVRPQIDPLRHADAILVLGGQGYDRYVLGFQLGEQGWAPDVVVSNPNGPGDRWLTKYCATPNAEFRLHCFNPDPDTTRGEGRELHRLADLHGWRTVIVVTFRPHISRARFILEQCFDGDLVMVNSRDLESIQSWVAEYFYQTAGYVRAVLQPGC
jgi:uncharacterized SAM-binding protein YcdF (DUF218 family)